MSIDQARMATWLSRQGWRDNPFNFSVRPDLFVGYSEQAQVIQTAIYSNQKLILLLGPTGSGKTTLLKWIDRRLVGHDVIFLAKPPVKSEDFIQIFNQKYAGGFLFFRDEATSLFDLPDFLNRRLKRPLVLIVDEAHEAPTDVLEWLRVLSDQVRKMNLVLSALPIFEEQLSEKLETLKRRISVKTEILSLTKETMEDMISKRMKAVGGEKYFTPAMLTYIWEQSAGFPREVLRICSKAVEKAADIGADIDQISPEVFVEPSPGEEPTIPKLESLPPRQRMILQILVTPMTPAQIVDQLPPEEYPDREHAIRAVNNILKRLYQTGLVERTMKNKAYVYSLSPKIKTIFVQK